MLRSSYRTDSLSRATYLVKRQENFSNVMYIVTFHRGHMVARVYVCAYYIYIYIHIYECMYVCSPFPRRSAPIPTRYAIRISVQPSVGTFERDGARAHYPSTTIIIDACDESRIFGISLSELDPDDIDKLLYSDRAVTKKQPFTRMSKNFLLLESRRM